MTGKLQGGASRRLAAEIRRELSALERLQPEVAGAVSLLDQPEAVRNTLIVRGSADLLHDFYTCVEKVFELIASTLDGGLPEGSRWHRRLLDAMAVEVPGYRPAVVTAETQRQLDEYLRFRHLFRNVYGLELDAERILPLLKRLGEVREALSRDLSPLLQLLDMLAETP